MRSGSGPAKWNLSHRGGGGLVTCAMDAGQESEPKYKLTARFPQISIKASSQTKRSPAYSSTRSLSAAYSNISDRNSTPLTRYGTYHYEQPCFRVGHQVCPMLRLRSVRRNRDHLRSLRSPELMGLRASAELPPHWNFGWAAQEWSDYGLLLTGEWC